MRYIIAILLLHGCAQIDSEVLPVEQPLPIEPEVIIEPEAEPEPIVEQPTVIETVAPIEYHEVRIIVDDERFDPKVITVPEGPVRISFIFDQENINKGGMDIRSQKFNIDYRTGDYENIVKVNFTANFPFGFIGFRPGTETIKTSGRIEIK